MVRHAKIEELKTIKDIYIKAKQYMNSYGNINQWNNNYPNIEIITNDILNKRLYVCYDEELIYGVFYFYKGIDPTYNYIEGKWLNDEEYGTIHRIASNGLRRGVLDEALAFCLKYVDNVRIDTHHDNIVMRNKLASLKFIQCGIIYIQDGSPRIAYQFKK